MLPLVLVVVEGVAVSWMGARGLGGASLVVLSLILRGMLVVVCLPMLLTLPFPALLPALAAPCAYQTRLEALYVARMISRLIA